MMPDGRILRAPTTLLLKRYSRYDWITDYPVAKQTLSEEGKSNITLEFQLSDEEVLEFRTEIKSNLNGTLPIRVSFGKDTVDLSVQKPGKGHATLNRKSSRIADFVSKRIRFEYIPAIRTASSASQVISKLLESGLERLEDLDSYKAAIDQIEQLQRPVLDDLAETIRTTVTNFLPSVKAVRLEIRRDARQRALRREVEILVDDGNETRLERKGDGVQSLVALALMKHASEQSRQDCSTVIAIEEPESHLHPRAVHELRAVIEDLSEKNQIVLSSHSPLFVNLNHLGNTVIVKESRAKPASSVAEIRETLGVRFSDNLQNAALVILVEGSDDVVALKSICTYRSATIAEAVKSGMLAFDFLGGASSLTQKASFYKSSACNVQCFLDDDAEGRGAVDRALERKALKIAEVNLCSVPSSDESELEDLYDSSLYRDRFLKEFGVDPCLKVVSNKKAKWSTKMEQRFRAAGKPWNNQLKLSVKAWLAHFASCHPESIVRQELESPLATLVSTVESRLPRPT